MVKLTTLETAGQWVVLCIVIIMLVWLGRCVYMCWANTRPIEGEAEARAAQEDEGFTSAEEEGDDVQDEGGDGEFGFDFVPGKREAPLVWRPGAGAAPSAERAPSASVAAQQLVVRDDVDNVHRSSIVV